MSKGNSRGEVGENPAREESQPDILDLVVELLTALGSEGADVLKNMQLSERDLRTIALDPNFYHALDRADKLTDARLALERLRERLAEWAAAEQLIRNLGQKSLEQVPLQETQIAP